MPMFVITAISTQAICAIRVISPGSDMPSSITAASAPERAIWNMVIGTPTWEFALPAV